MDRITPKEVLSMMQAVAQVYEQPEAEQLDEIVRNLRPGESVKEYEERKRKEAEAAAKNRDKIVPNRGAYDELTKAQQNSKTQRENEKKLEDLRRQRRRDDEEGLKPPTANLPSDLKDTEQTATAAGQKAAGKSMGGLPADYKETELQAGKDAEKSRTGAGLPQSGGGNQGNYGKGSTTTTTPTPTPKPQLTDQQKVRAEYDRLRKKDPKTGKVMGSPEDLKKAAAYGMAMSKAGAANKDFSGYKSAADLDKAKSDAKSNAGPGGYQIPAGAKPITKAPISTTKPAATATSTSGPGGYQLSVDARPKSNIGRVASNLANSDAKPAAAVAATATNNYPGGKVGATSAAQPAATSAATPAAATPAAKPRAQVRGREAMMAAQRNRAAKPAPTPAVKAPATPAAKPAGSIADRLQQIRDMRARSQSRITAQGGTPATPPVNPTPKATPPSTTGATTTPVAKVNKKQPLKNGDPMERMTGKGAASLMETYSKVYEEREPQAIDEGIMGALKKVGKAVLGPADQSPEAEAARMGKRRPYVQQKKREAAAVAIEKLKTQGESYDANADLFDIIKGHFIEEGLTEEEALAKMLDLTDEERTEIIEGNRRPFSDAGEYPMRDAMRDAGMNRAPHAPVVPVKKAQKKSTTKTVA